MRVFVKVSSAIFVNYGFTIGGFLFAFWWIIALIEIYPHLVFGISQALLKPSIVPFYIRDFFYFGISLMIFILWGWSGYQFIRVSWNWLKTAHKGDIPKTPFYQLANIKR